MKFSDNGIIVNSVPQLITQQMLGDMLEYLQICNNSYKIEVLSRILSVIDPQQVKEFFFQNWMSVTDIANELNLSKQKVGQIISALNLRRNPKYSISYIIKINDLKYSTVHFYNKKALILIKNYVKQYQKEK